jgi:cellulose synthase (UDP-forming)
MSACGIDARQPWWAVLWSCLFTHPLPGNTDWNQLAKLFPHVNFTRLRLGDLLRIPFQLLWLILVKPPAPKTPGPSLEIRRRLWWVKLKRWLRRLLPAFAKNVAATAMQHLRHHTQFDTQTLRRKSESYAGHHIWDQPLLRYAAYGIAAILTVMCITTPASMLAQTVFVVLLWSIAMLIRRIPGQVPMLLLIVLSVAISTRYLWWRIAYTLNWDRSLDLLWGMLLIAAEIYTWLILLLGYIQSSWPLKRPPFPMPADTKTWPHVDVYIPTYNEPMSVVKPTVYAAMGLDWPHDKLHIYLLDDGRREEFRDFAAAVGIGYIIRPDNNHAKAGNLNHALTKTSGEHIAIFDCDHIPTRSFLQVTMGWFMCDPKLALVQTPHHFFSPDPFEKNLGKFRAVPNEGELFYGVIQDGNDLWNATFFCGSCAVIKRAPLLEVGGIAVETVTEDAHTALKMQRLGYATAYLNLPQAAGLATESLSAHIGQRIRWARGMAQIFRLDNPFLGKGLSWTQRVCYSNAMLSFFNGAPRLIFLTAPLAFLLFHAYVIYTPALSVLLYVIPHMAHANLVNSRLQGKYRHSFWAEVYETVLSWYIVRPTTVALINPRLGKFNVTAKGGLVEKNYFDWQISMPFLVLIAFNLLGFGFGIWRIFWGPADEIATTLLNLFWTTYNILLLGAAVAVASEAKQIRRSHRVQLNLPALLHFPDGKIIRCHTADFSEGGTALVMPDGLPALAQDEQVLVTLWRGEEEFSFPALVTATIESQLRLRWNLTSREQEIALIQCTFGRADAWISWNANRRQDQPLSSLGEVLSIGMTGYARIAREITPFAAPVINRIGSLYAGLTSLLPRTPPALMKART